MITRDVYGIGRCIRPGREPEERTGKDEIHAMDPPETIRACLNCEKSERECHGSCPNGGGAGFRRDEQIRELARIVWSGKGLERAMDQLGITKSKATRWACTETFKREIRRLRYERN